MVGQECPQTIDFCKLVVRENLAFGKVYLYGLAGLNSFPSGPLPGGNRLKIPVQLVDLKRPISNLAGEQKAPPCGPGSFPRRRSGAWALRDFAMALRDINLIPGPNTGAAQPDPHLSPVGRQPWFWWAAPYYGHLRIPKNRRLSGKRRTGPGSGAMKDLARPALTRISVATSRRSRTKLNLCPAAKQARSWPP